MVNTGRALLTKDLLVMIVNTSDAILTKSFLGQKCNLYVMGFFCFAIVRYVVYVGHPMLTIDLTLILVNIRHAILTRVNPVMNIAYMGWPILV